MDFLTYNRLMGPETEVRLSDWLRAAIGAIAVLRPDQVFLPTDRGGPAEPVKKTVDPRQRHPSSLHSHTYPEVCVCVGGRALMEMSDRAHGLRAPSVFLALPQTPHCQAHTKDESFHAFVWLTVSQGDMLVVTSAYRAGKGWSDSARDSLRGEDVRRLSTALFARAEGCNFDALESTRASLLQVLNRVYQRAVRRDLQGDIDEVGPQNYHQPVLRYVRAYIDDNLDARMTLRELGEMARLSPNYLNRLFRQWTGQPLHQYKIRRRMETAMQLLREGKLLVKQVARRVGYEDPLYFSRAFHDYYGEWPTDVCD
jgi:AraC-like DNA-binding protein/quercetin dioxygenase-like cupin family protein